MTEEPNSTNGLSYADAQQAFSDQSLFENKTWRYSPQAFPLSRKQVAEIRKIGQACYDFHRALEALYLRSVEGKNLLRNRDLVAPWVAEYLFQDGLFEGEQLIPRLFGATKIEFGCASDAK